MLKDNILSSAVLWASVSFMVSTALIAWRIEDKCKIGIVGISLYFSMIVMPELACSCSMIASRPRFR